jgi:hypothetical protein
VAKNRGAYNIAVFFEENKTVECASGANKLEAGALACKPYMRN